MTDQATPRPPVQVSAVHYQILCGGGLALIFVAQSGQGMMLGNLLVVCVGLIGMLTGMRLAPVLTLIILVLAQAGNHVLLSGWFNFIQDRPFLDLGDLLLALGALAYVAGHYRLQSIRRNAVPVDPRQRRRVQGKRGVRHERILEPRSEKLLTPQEIARFVLSLPVWAFAGQVAWALVSAPWLATFPDMRVNRLLTLAWLLIIGALTVGLALNVWRRRQMTTATAQVYLQDVLWKETRREQRRIFRWLGWRRVQELDRTKDD
jgi:hypothetical protein